MRIILIILFFNITPAFAKPSFDAHTVFDQAGDSLDVFRYQSAIDDMQTAIAMDADNVQKYIPLIELYYKNQLWDKAEEVLKDAIYSCQNDQGVDLNGWLADDLLDQHRWNEAKGYLDKAIKSYPDEPMLYYDLAIYYFNKGDYIAAGKLMKTIALKDKGTEDTYYDLYDQIADQVKENHPGLIQMAQAALDEEPNNFKTHRLYAATLRNSYYKDFDRQLPEILGHLNTALKLNPKYSLTLVTFADTYLMLGKNHQSAEYFKTSLEWLDKIRALNDPAYKRLDYDYANTYSEMSQYDKAIEYAEAYHKQFPDDQDGLDELGIVYNNYAYECYQQGKDLQKGITFINKALKLNPEDGMYISTKAELLYKLKQYQEAYKLIQQAHTKLPTEPEINQDVTMIEKAL